MRRYDGLRIVPPHLSVSESHTLCVNAFPRGGLLFIVSRPRLLASDGMLSASGKHSFTGAA